MAKLEWELVETHEGGNTSCLKIPGGWLYRVIERFIGDERESVQVVFVPVELVKWEEPEGDE